MLNKDFWTRAIGFTTTTAGQLNKAHVQFLESRLIALARAAKRMPLDRAGGMEGGGWTHAEGASAGGGRAVAHLAV